eukprot:gene8040-biopygen13633
MAPRRCGTICPSASTARALSAERRRPRRPRRAPPSSPSPSRTSAASRRRAPAAARRGTRPAGGGRTADGPEGVPLVAAPPPPRGIRWQPGGGGAYIIGGVSAPGGAPSRTGAGAGAGPASKGPRRRWREGTACAPLVVAKGCNDAKNKFECEREIAPGNIEPGNLSVSVKWGPRGNLSVD